MYIGWRRRVALIGICLVVSIGGAATALLRMEIFWGSALAGVFAGLVTIMVAVASIMRRRSDPELTADPELTVDRTAEMLAKLMHRRCEEVLHSHSKYQSLALLVRWRTDAGGTPSQGASLHDLRSRIQPGQVIIWGPAGSGKSTVALRLALIMLANRHTGQPVPVWFEATALIDGRHDVWENMAEGLVAEYPWLSGPVGAKDFARQLLGTGMLVPVIDGLDELPDGLGAQALASLRSAAPGQSFIVTCRPDQFRWWDDQIDVSAPELLTVELLPPAVSDVASYLARSVPAYDQRWLPMLDALGQHQDSPLAHALLVPMNVPLVRSIYSRADSAPSELLDVARFPTRSAIENHLLGELIPAAFDGRGVPPKSASAWLTFFASGMERQGTCDLAWWRLPRMVPAGVFWGASAFLGTVTGVVAGMLSDVALGGISGVAVTISSLLVRRNLPLPRSVGWSWRRGSDFLGAVATLLTVTLVAVGWLVLARAPDKWALLTVGLGFALIGAVVPVVGVPVVLGEATSPRAVSRQDLRYTVLGSVLSGAVGLAAGWAAFGWLPAMGTALAGVAIGATYSVSYQVFVSRIWLALRGRAPLALFGFLDEAHRRGVLRRAGPVYQFRHIMLQRHLASAAEADDSVQAPGSTPASEAITGLRAHLVDEAFRKVDVQAVIEPDRVNRLKDEIGAELRYQSPRIAAATLPQRERLALAKTRYIDKVAVPRLARARTAYGWAFGFLVGYAVLSITRPALNISLSMTLFIGSVAMATGAVFAILPAIERGRLRVLAEPPGGETDRVPRRKRALASVPAIPERWWPYSMVLARLCVAAGGAALTVGGLAAWNLTEFLTQQPRAGQLATSVAASALVLWWWARPRYARFRALSREHVEDWPPAGETPWAASARRTAVQAWNEWVGAVIDVGVLPLVSAKVEPLTRRNFNTTLPAASVEQLGDITSSVQFVPTDESDRLNRIFAATLTTAIGVSGPRGVGKSTLLRRFGDQRIGSAEDNLTLVVSAPTNYNGRDFLVHLFARLCLALLPADEERNLSDNVHRRTLRWWPWAAAGAGVLIAATAAWWEVATAIPGWARGNLRSIVIGGGIMLLTLPAVRGVSRVLRRRAAREDTSIQGKARYHLRRLRYLETLTLSRTATVKTPAGVEFGGASGRQRAEQIRTYPQLVSDFREFLGTVGLHLRSRPDRGHSRVVICIDELDKIASAEQAEQFLNDIKTVFGVDGSVFLVAVSEDALSAFARRALAVRTTFDTAFDEIIAVQRFALADTRRLLVQRVLRLPEPYVWLCHSLSGGLPRDLNRIVRRLYDIKSHRGVDQLDALASELVRQDLDFVAYGLTLKLAGRSDRDAVGVVRWLAAARHLPPTAEAVRAYAETAPQEGDLADPEIALMTAQFQAYLHYLGALLVSFLEETVETIGKLHPMDDKDNPVRHLAEARAALSTDPTAARCAVDAFVAATARVI